MIKSRAGFTDAFVNPTYGGANGSDFEGHRLTNGKALVRFCLESDLVPKPDSIFKPCWSLTAQPY
ncbi:hypothetical protein [Arachidicoccus sp.]|uniref:hypothetical protein n=1 Tax=Arachidicoccus sp. TaxID=1872624 RepID=UPI003D1D1DB6